MKNISRFSSETIGNLNFSYMHNLRFILLVIVIVFLYFELSTQVWFLNLTGGYLLRVWIPPFLLISWIVLRKVVLKEKILEWNLINTSLLLYGAFGLVAMLKNESLYLSGKYYLIMIAPVWAFAVVVEWVESQKEIERIFSVLFCCSVLLMLYHFLLQIAPDKLPGFLTRDVVTHMGNHMLLGADVYKVFDPKGGPGELHSRGLWSYEYGKYAAIVSPMALYAFYQFIRRADWVRFVYLAVGAGLMYQIVYTLSRAGIASLAIGTVVLLICLFRVENGKRRWLVFLAVFLAIELALIVYFDRPFLIKRYLQAMNVFGNEQVNQTLIDMGVHWKESVKVPDPHIRSAVESLNAWSQSPLLGAGFTKIQEFIELNRFIFVLTSAGLLTFIPYLIFFMVVMVRIFRAMIRFTGAERPGMNYGHLFFAIAVMYMVKLNIYEALESYYYWIAFGLATAWANIEKGPEKHAV